MKRLLITIDGPAGAGKTTVSRMLADRLGYRYVDTGALYRAVACQAAAAGIDASDDQRLGQLCATLNLEFIQGGRLFANHKDITDQIRSPAISMLASAVSARAPVRRFLLGVQRRIGQNKAAVFEGRDMGTVVFPEADVKFYLDASPIIRAMRRHREMGDRPSQDLEAVEAEIRRRDTDDSTRKLAPLKPAPEAVRIDSTDLSAEQVVDEMLIHIGQVLNFPPNGG